MDDFLGILTALLILLRLLITKYWVTRIIMSTSVALTGGVKCGLVNPYLVLRLVFHWPDTNSVRSAGFKSINADFGDVSRLDRLQDLWPVAARYLQDVSCPRSLVGLSDGQVHFPWCDLVQLQVN